MNTQKFGDFVVELKKFGGVENCPKYYFWTMAGQLLAFVATDDPDQLASELSTEHGVDADEVFYETEEENEEWAI